MQGVVISCFVFLAQFRPDLGLGIVNIGHASDEDSIGTRLGLDFRNISRFWENGTVPYKYASNFDDDHKHLIEIIFNEFRSYCVNFREMGITDDDTIKDYVKIIYNSEKGRCYSDDGRLGGQQYMTFSDRECFKLDQIRHQVLHTLGFKHEHKRPDRDCFIKFISDVDVNSGNLKKDDSLNMDFPYDINSIMHYGKYFIDEYKQLNFWQAFTKDPQIRLTELDKYKVKYVYCNYPTGHPVNVDYSAGAWCRNGHQAACDEDTTIREACGFSRSAV